MRLVRWLLSLPAGIFYCVAALTIDKALGFPGGAPALCALLAQYLLPGSIALWLLADARRRGRSLPYDTGTLFFIAWPVVAPIYLFATRGWRAFAVLGRFFLLYLAAACFSYFLYFLHAVLR